MSARRTIATTTKKAAKHTGPPPGWLMPRIQERREAKQRQEESDANFLVGGKKVYLPNWHIEMQHNPRLTPHEAQFQVPLHFSKLDLKDLLWHAYNVRTHAIRSWVTATRPLNVVPGSIRDVPGKKREYLPKGKKRMIVTLDSPFVWPEPPIEEGTALGQDDVKRSAQEKEAQGKMRSGRLREAERREEGQNTFEAMVERLQKVEDGETSWDRTGSGLEEVAEATEDLSGEKQYVSPLKSQQSSGGQAAVNGGMQAPAPEQETEKWKDGVKVVNVESTTADGKHGKPSDLSVMERGTKKQADKEEWKKEREELGLPPQPLHKKKVFLQRDRLREAGLAIQYGRPRGNGRPDQKVVEL